MGSKADRNGRAASGEFGLIARYLAPLARGAKGAFGLLDDAAVLDVPKGYQLVVTKDALVEGVHLLPGDPPALIAQKLLRVNLSDLAAKGARPIAYAMMLALPKREDAFLAAFARGLKVDQRRFGLHLIGGDTVKMPGPLTLSATMFGLIPKGGMIRRDGARPGDLVMVTGSIGDAGMGLACLQEVAPAMSQAAKRFFIGRYHLPQPRVAFGSAIRGVAHAAMDVSDGLVADLGKLCAASGVGARLDLEAVPLSRHLAQPARKDAALRVAALGAGDDYEILFTVPQAQLKRVKALAGRLKVPVSVIGTITKGRAVKVFDAGNRPVRMTRGGFEHF